MPLFSTGPSIIIQNGPQGPPGEAGLPSVNAADIGFDVVLLIGQDNMKGSSQAASLNSLLDYTDPRILQYTSSQSDGGVVLAVDPLKHASAFTDGSIGLAMQFSRQLVLSITNNRRVLLIPRAVANTGFADNQWNPGDSAYEAAVNDTNAVLALSNRNRIVAVLWHGGEKDAVAGMSESLYATRIDAMITGIRNDISGALSVPFVVGDLAPTYVGSNASRIAIQTATRGTATRLPYVAVASAESLTTHSSFLFSAISYRELGVRYYNALVAARSNVPNVPPNAPTDVGATVTSSAVQINWTQVGSVPTSWSYRYKLAAVTTWGPETTVTSRPLTITGLSSGTMYSFQVKALNAFGESIYSDAITFTTSTIATPSPTPTPGPSPTPTPTPMTFDTTISANTGVHINGVLLTANAGDQLKFNSSSGTDVSPIRMSILINSVEVAAVDALGRHVGLPFEFVVASTGFRYQGAITNGSVNVTRIT